MTLACFKVWI